MQSTKNAIYICADRKFMVQAFYVAAAISRERDSGDTDFDVIIIADDAEVDDSHLSWMESNRIRHVGDLDTKRLDHINIANERLSTACLYRLLAPEYFSDEYDRLIQLDADLEIRGPLAPLFSLDLAGMGIAAAPSGDITELFYSSEKRQKFHDELFALGLTNPLAYFNVGVMLIDVEWWNRGEISRRSLEFLSENLEGCRFLDEYALSVLMNGKFARLSPVWNLRSWTSRVPGAQSVVDPVVVHFDGPVKPWQRFGEFRPLFHYEKEYQNYREFLQGTPWQGWLKEQWKAGDLAKNFMFYAHRLHYGLLGKSSWAVFTPSRRRTMLEAFARNCREAAFADVEQGLVVRENGVLRAV